MTLNSGVGLGTLQSASKREDVCNTQNAKGQEHGRQEVRRLQIGSNGLFFADFFSNIQLFVSEIDKNLAIAGANFC